jgi:hypothetical protein
MAGCPRLQSSRQGTMTARQRLENRRYTETFDMPFGDQRTVFKVSIGFWPDRREPAEVFITGAKAGSEFEAVARDGAVLLSIALQYGVPLFAVQSAITRNQDGSPATIIGAVVDKIALTGQ